MDAKGLILRISRDIANDKGIDINHVSYSDVCFELAQMLVDNDSPLHADVVWVAIKDEMPPVSKYVLMVSEDDYMRVEFVDAYSLTTKKYPKNYTHWANQPSSPNS
jgi:hypothetical protein